LRFKVEGLDGVDKFLDRDLSAAIIVKDIEDFFEFGDSLGSQSLLCVFVCVESGFGHLKII